MHEDGTGANLKLRLYALSTCAFCRRAIEFLKSHGLAFEYIYLDKIDVEVKRALKAELKEQYQNLPVFPVLTISDKQAISGFREGDYLKALGLDNQGAT